MQGNKATAILITCFAAFGGILYGFDTGLISGLLAMPYFRETFGHPTDVVQEDGHPFALSTGTKSLFTSILSLGTFVGALLGAPISDILGRRPGLQVGCLIFSVGVAIQTGTTSSSVFVVGRVFAGMGIGVISVIVPMYQSECAPKWIRGSVVSCYQWAITIGLLLASICTNAFKNILDHSSYRWPISIQFILAAVLAGGMFILPESPRWYVKTGKYDQAARSLARLLSAPVDSEEVQTELAEIRAALEHEQALTGSQTWLQGYTSCFSTKDKYRNRTLVGIFIQAWQQLTGINFIFYYGTTFFQNSGISNPFTISIITNCVNVGTTPIGIYFVERLGRRKLLLIGAAGMLVCEYLVAIIGVALPASNDAGQKVLIAFVCIYIAFFATTWGPIAWVVCGEIFPLAIRGKAISMSVASNWLWNFAIGYATPYLVDSGAGNAGLGVKVFFIWGTTCTLAGVFVYLCVPETRGLSLEEVDHMYATTSVRQSMYYKPHSRQELDHHDSSRDSAEKRAHEPTTTHLDHA